MNADDQKSLSDEDAVHVSSTNQTGGITAGQIAKNSFNQPISIAAALVKLGGEGGRDGGGGGGGAAIGYGAFGGPGGKGGGLTLYGATRFDLDGEIGNAPGAGGGGGGAGLPTPSHEWFREPQLPQDEPPLATGVVRVTSMFVTDACCFDNRGLLCTAGGVWDWQTISTLPGSLLWKLVVVAHLSKMMGRERILLTAIVRDPEHRRVLEKGFWVNAGQNVATQPVDLAFRADTAGTWTIAVNEGANQLSWIPIDLRLEPKKPSPSPESDG